MRKLFILFILTGAILNGDRAIAQYNPLISQYYNNGYLANPALAGIKQGYNVNLVYRKQWTNIPGSPEIQNFTGQYGNQSKKVGLGLNINFDRAGLQKLSNVSGTYAYHLPLNGENEALHFGVSLGFMNQRLIISDIVGNTNDPMAAKYNDRKTFVNGEFGIAYTSSGLKIEAALPNLKQLLKRNRFVLGNTNTFYSAVSYVVGLANGMDHIEVEPKLVYRGMRNIANVWDFGTQVSLAKKQLMLMGMYHSSKSASFGVGAHLKQKYLVSGAYTTQTGALSSYANGSFEINLGISL